MTAVVPTTAAVTQASTLRRDRDPIQANPKALMGTRQAIIAPGACRGNAPKVRSPGSDARIRSATFISRTASIQELDRRVMSDRGQIRTCHDHPQGRRDGAGCVRGDVPMGRPLDDDP